ncbi:hypothetical protein AcW1_007024 [Taiwanofungus camphoratus]|nr:hypothetical protein AcW1_007024 [Antrodia cinnamomea]
MQQIVGPDASTGKQTGQTTRSYTIVDHHALRVTEGLRRTETHTLVRSQMDTCPVPAADGRWRSVDACGRGRAELSSPSYTWASCPPQARSQQSLPNLQAHSENRVEMCSTCSRHAARSQAANAQLGANRVLE